ncbi:hypothetical protein ACHAXS_011132 [Conticribra weissflogii]
MQRSRIRAESFFQTMCNKSNICLALAIYTVMAITTDAAAFSVTVKNLKASLIGNEYFDINKSNDSMLRSRQRIVSNQSSLHQLHSSMSDDEGENFRSSDRRVKDTGPKNTSTSKNEFSRTIRVSKWFAPGGGDPRGANRHGSTKSTNLSITATSSECKALAERFRLLNITSLSAELVIRPAFGVGGGGAGTGGSHRGGREDNHCVEARGTVMAQVTQNCVRTNEEFDVDLEFSFDTVFRAMESTSLSANRVGKGSESQTLSDGELAALEAAADLNNVSARKNRTGKKQRGGKKGVKGLSGSQSSRDLDSMGMKELQDILMDYEVTDEIIEDETCFCTDGIVDAGEIVAQMFRSKLDPYPRNQGRILCRIRSHSKS